MTFWELVAHYLPDCPLASQIIRPQLQIRRIPTPFLINHEYSDFPIFSQKMGLKCWNANCDGHTEPNLLIAASPASAPATASGSTAARTETVQYAMGEMVHHAVACPLIDALPVEIRVQIYEYMLFENGSFFSLEDEEGNSVPTLFPKLRAPSKKRGQPPVLSVTGGGARDPQAIGSGRRGNIMSLLLVNKQM